MKRDLVIFNSYQISDTTKRYKMKKLITYLFVIFFWISVIYLMVSFPFIFIGLIFCIILIFIIAARISIYKHSKFIKENNGKIIFLYSSKKRWLKHIKSYILPTLGNDIILVYNEYGKLKSTISLDSFNYYYYKVDKLKHPLFIKIVDDNAIAISIYDNLVDLHDNKFSLDQFQKQIKQKLKYLESQTE